jgi:beta-phosphoglucomutase
MIKAVVFDLDGVLVDATEWHYQALNQALQIFGYEISREDHVGMFNGLPTVEKLKLLSKEKGLPLGLHEAIKKLKRKLTDEKVLSECRPSYEKQLMLQALKRKYKLAVCSNAQKYSVLNMLNQSQITSYFSIIVGNDEGFRPKPFPDMYVATYKKLKVNPSEVIVVEDSAYGIKAAITSGAKVIAVKGYHDVSLSLFEKYL